MSRSNVLGAWCPLVICIVLSTVAAAPPEAWVSNGESGHDVDGCGLDQFSPCSSVSFAWFQFFNAGIQLHLDVGQYSLASVPIVNASNVTIIGSGSGLKGTQLGCTTAWGRAVELGPLASRVTLSRVRIHGCGGVARPTVGGGVLVNGTAHVVFDRVVVASCSADSGGAVGVLNGASILVVASTLANNTAVSGGAMLVSGTSSAQVTNSELSHNTAAAPLGTQAAAPGGALIVQDNAVVILTHATVTLNTAGDHGGAVHLLGYAELQAYASQISDNTAVEGAGIYAQDAATVSITASTIADNQANVANTGSGGALRMLGAATGSINASTFLRNTAAKFGGDMALSGSVSVVVHATTFNSSFVKRGLGLVIFSTSAGALSLVDSSVVDSSCAWGDCEAYLMLQLPESNGKANTVDIRGCTFSQVQRPQFTPRRSVFVRPSQSSQGSGVAGIGTRWLALTVTGTQFTTGTESHFVFDGVNVNATITDSTFRGARTVSLQRGSANLVFDGLTVDDVSVQQSGGFLQLTCMSAAVSCHVAVRRSQFLNVRTTGDTAYGGLFAIAGPSTVLNATRINVTLEHEGNGADRGGVFAVLNGATAYVTSSTLQGRANFGGVFYLGPALLPWPLDESDRTEEVGATVVAVGCRFHGSRGVEGGAVVDANVGITKDEPQSVFKATDCVFDTCTAEGEGGVVTTWRGLEMVANNCTFSGNSATGTGGGGGVISVSRNSLLTFNDCVFADNKASHVGGTLLAKDNSRVVFNRGSVSDGWAKSGGVMYVQDTSEVFVNGTVFHNNSADIAGVATLVQTGKVTCHRCQFIKNFARQLGGVFNAVGSSKQDITDLNVIDSHFRQCSSLEGDGGAVSLGLSASAEFRACLFDNTTALQGAGGAIFMDAASLLKISNVSFARAGALSGGAIFATGAAQVQGRDIVFSMNRANIGGAIATTGLATSLVLRSSFDNNVASQLGGTLYLSDQGRAELLSTLVSGSTCRNGVGSPHSALCSGGVLHVGSFATFLARDTTFRNSSASGSGGVMSATGRADATFANCTVDTASANAAAMFSLDTLSRLSVTDSSLVKGRAVIAGGALVLGFSAQAQLHRTSITDVLVERGAGGVAALSDDTIIFVQDCNISETRVLGADVGHGSIFAQNGASKSFVVRSSFAHGFAEAAGGFVALADHARCAVDDSWIRNFTTQGFGGMGYVASDSSGFLNITNTEATTCVANRGGVAYVDSCANIDLSGSQFDKNLATEAGGVVYFDTIDNVMCPWVGCDNGVNKARGYGDCRATRIASIVAEPTHVYGVVSGADEAPPIVIYARDVYNSRITEIHDRVVVRVSTPSSVTLSNASHVDVSGSTIMTMLPDKVVRERRFFNFSELSLKGPPGTTQTIEFSVLFPVNVQGTVVKASFNRCVRGETLTSVCVKCPPNEYSFSNAASCLPCPANVYCGGGDSFLAHAGYWRKGNGTNVEKCRLAEACLGFTPDVNPADVENKCAPGYTGNMCLVCDYGYGRSRQAGCGKCPPKLWTRGYIAIGYFFSLSVIAFIVLYTRRRLSVAKDTFVMNARILISFLQTTGMAASLSLHLPEALIHYLSAMAGLTTGSDRLVAFDCWLHQEDSAVGEVFFELQVLYTLLPLAGMGSIVVLWFLGYWIMVWRHSKALKRPASNRSLNPEAPVPKPVSRRQRRTSSRDSASPRDSVSPSSTTAVVKPNKPEASSAGKLLSMAAYKRGLRRSYARGALMSMTVLWIGLHPTLCFQTFLLIGCQPLFSADPTSERYLSVNMNVPCDVNDDWRLPMLFGRLVFYVILPPVLAGTLLYRNRRNLGSPDVKKAWGFLYLGYSPRAYYWEIVVAIRKVLVAAVIVYASAWPLVQIMLPIGVLFAGTLLHSVMRPFHAVVNDDTSASQLPSLVDRCMSCGQSSKRRPPDDGDDDDDDTASPALPRRISISRGSRASRGSLSRADSSSSVASGVFNTPRHLGPRRSTAATLRPLPLVKVDKLHRLERWALLATVSVFYFGYFFVEELDEGATIAVESAIFAANGAFFLLFAASIGHGTQHAIDGAFLLLAHTMDNVSNACAARCCPKRNQKFRQVRRLQSYVAAKRRAARLKRAVNERLLEDKQRRKAASSEQSRRRRLMRRAASVGPRVMERAVSSPPPPVAVELDMKDQAPRAGSNGPPERARAGSGRSDSSRSRRVEFLRMPSERQLGNSPSPPSSPAGAGSGHGQRKPAKPRRSPRPSIPPPPPDVAPPPPPPPPTSPGAPTSPRP